MDLTRTGTRWGVWAAVGTYLGRNVDDVVYEQTWMADKRDGMALGDEDGQPEVRDQQDGPYEHPALEPERGNWAGRWAEFKRLFSASMKEKGCALIVIGVVWLVMLFGGVFLGWS